MTTRSLRTAADRPGRRWAIVAGFLILASPPLLTQTSPSDTAALLASLRTARIVELNFVWDAQSPLLALNPPFALSLSATHASTAGMIPGIAFAGDMMYFSGQHGAPTIDALGHISTNGRLYGGLDAAASEGPQGLKQLGIETYPRDRVVNRGVLLDVARFRRVDALAPGQEVTGDELEATAKAQGVEVRAGDSVLIRTGYGRLFTADKAKYLGVRPGVGESGARWLAARKVFSSGTDTLTYDVFPEAGTTFPAHRILIAENGIYLIESLNLEELAEVVAATGVREFPLVVNPLRIRGATGSPLNAFAILAR
jgi:kynurenine formamidase